MRALMLVAGAALSLAACGNNDQRDNTTNIDENLTAENIVSNDVTAIDAVTADAANMAADVNYTVEETNAVDNAVSNGPAPRLAPKPRAKQPAPAPDSPTANSAASNSTE